MLERKYNKRIEKDEKIHVEMIKILFLAAFIVAAYNSLSLKHYVGKFEEYGSFSTMVRNAEKWHLLMDEIGATKLVIFIKRSKKILIAYRWNDLTKVIAPQSYGVIAMHSGRCIIRKNNQQVNFKY